MQLFPSLRRAWIVSVWLSAGIAAVHLWPNAAAAQTPTVVQLPTFHFFTTNTTVLVPDGGDAFLGGVNSAASGSSERGIPGLPGRPFTNNAIGSSTGASNVSVSAQIHDFAALEDALIGPPAPPSDGFTSTLVSRPLPLQSVAALQAQQAAADAAHNQEAAAALERGRQLLAQHKLGVAKIYFQSAASQSSPASDVHRQALTELAAIAQAKAAAKIAGQ